MSAYYEYILLSVDSGQSAEDIEVNVDGIHSDGIKLSAHMANDA